MTGTLRFHFTLLRRKNAKYFKRFEHFRADEICPPTAVKHISMNEVDDCASYESGKWAQSAQLYATIVYEAH